MQALEAYQEAAKRNPDSPEVTSKIKALSRMRRSSAAQNGHSHKNLDGVISTAQAYDSTKAGIVSLLHAPITATAHVSGFLSQVLIYQFAGEGNGHPL